MDCTLAYDSDNNIYAIAPNGEKSLLFESLRNLVGEEVGKDMYSLTLTEDFKDVINSKFDPFNKSFKKSKEKGLTVDIKTVNGKLTYLPYMNGEKAGGLRMSKYKDGFKIDSILVYDNFQKQGIGSELYRRAINDLTKSGKSVYSLKVRTPQADRIWQDLVSKGVAKKIGDDYVVEAILDENGEANVETVGNYANTTQATLGKEQLIEAKDVAMSFNVTNNKELAKKLNDAFVEDGFIIFDRAKMRKAGYTEYEVTKILSDTNLQNEIKTNLPKIKNSEFEVEYNSEFVSPQNTNVNFLGKLKVENPYIHEQNLKPQQNVKTIVDGEIVDKVSDTEVVLQKSYPINPQPISENLNTLFDAVKVVREDVLIDRNDYLKKVIAAIKRETVKYGLDLKDIENRIYPISKLKDFIASVENYIKNPGRAFSKVYDDFFDINTVLTRPSTSDSLNDIILETELSEYELFRDHGLIRKKGDIYTKVAKLDDLFERYSSNPNNAQSIEEIESKVPLMKVIDEDIDGDTLSQLYIWKTYLNYPIETKSNKTVDYIDISKVVSNPYLKATYKGITLISNDPITKDNSELYEEGKIEEPIESRYDDNLNKRLLALQSPESFPAIKSDYVLIKDGIVMSKNEVNQFVKIGDDIYEKTFERDNLSFFNKVDGLEKDFSDIDYTQYLPLSTVEDIWVRPSVTNNKEVNKKYFDCK